MNLTASEIAQMIDVSAVQANSSDTKVVDLVNCAKKYQCYLVTVLPSQTQFTRQLIGSSASPKLGGNVGFPSGGQSTRTKVYEACELVNWGVDEIDMVIDIAAQISGRSEKVYQDIHEVVEAAEGKPVKVILECHYLDENQIRSGCDMAIKAGAAFIKTGTGWAPTGATLENIALIKNHVGDAIKIKASGGIRNIGTLMGMYKLGVSRFGISTNSAIKILSSI
jgi:deoxyribose-phosphate aldolase